MMVNISKLVKILSRNKIIRDKKDLVVFTLSNTNPFQPKVIKIYSKFTTKNYVIKNCTRKEIRNLFILDTIISQSSLGKKCQVLKPIDNMEGLFLFDYMGEPLSKTKNISPPNLFKFITELNDFLIRRNYFWKGLALRNIFYDGSRYILIDFEDLHRINKKYINKKFILFLKLNLIQFFDPKVVERYIATLKNKYKFTNYRRNLDEFEKGGWFLFTLIGRDKNSFFDLSDSITIEAEKPLARKNTIPFEVGHIIDETVPPGMSFFWTWLSADIRKNNAKRYTKILHEIKKIIKQGNEIIFKIYIVTVLSNLKTNIIKQAVESLDYQACDKIIIGLVKNICYLLKIDYNQIFLIARGSYGEVVLTKKSDLDFEIIEIKNDKARPLLPLENLVCEILNYLGLKVEGSKGRPKEKDICIKEECRDFYEFFEMRLISGDIHVFNKYRQQFMDLIEKKDMWNTQSKYEKKHKKINNKIPFEEIRFIITRLALYNMKCLIPSKIEEKIKICPPKYIKRLRILLNRSKKLRIEKADNLKKSLKLILEMNRIREDFGLPKNNLVDIKR